MWKKIKSHKGGRDKDLHVRLTADEKKMIQNKALKFKVSQADLIVNAVRVYQVPENG